MTLICLSQYVSQVRVHPIRMAFTMYACQGGGSKLPSLKVLYKDERRASVLLSRLHQISPISVCDCHRLSLHQHNSPAKPRTQEALRASTTNWSSSISLFFSVSLFPYHALFVRFKAFPLCFLPWSSKRERCWCFRDDSPLIPLKTPFKPPFPVLLPLGWRDSAMQTDWTLEDFSRAFKAKSTFWASWGELSSGPWATESLLTRSPLYRHYTGACAEDKGLQSFCTDTWLCSHAELIWASVCLAGR